MNRNKIENWCKQNNWSEPRQLESGSWVAFPPGGIIENPLPLRAKLIAQTKNNSLLDLVYGLIATVAGIIVATIALIISPLFLPIVIQKHRQRRSMFGIETYNN